MNATRIYAPARFVPGAVIELPSGARDHLRARRLQSGDNLTLFDGDGRSAAATLETLDRKGASACVDSVQEGSPESPIAPVLIQGLGKGDAMDLAVQKATELGVARIAPVHSDNTAVRLKADRAQRKHEHWQRVAVSACEQCGRNTLPRIEPPQPLEDAAAALADKDGVVLSADAPTSIGGLSPPTGDMVIAVGPEGGFSEREIGSLTHQGWRACHLGPRVLRMETAALTGLAALGLLFGDLG